MKEDWSWLVAKLEKILKSWSFHWLSRAGRLVLVKSVLESILVYWISLAWLPKGTLEKLRRTCFRFLWAGSKEHFVLPWVKWNIMVVPKLLGGWGLKNIHLFSKALAAKVGWRLITTDILWTKVVTQKYICPDTVEEWIRRPVKVAANCTIIWKALVKYFQVVGEGLAWRVGNGLRVRIGTDPWPGSGRGHLLPQPLIEVLHDRGFYYLEQIVDRDMTTIWSQAWKRVDQLGLDREYEAIWDGYIRALQLGHICITDREDDIVWQHNPHGVYTPKAGYTQLNIDLLQQEPSWWWKGVWKQKFPLKAHLFLWCLIKNKVPTWDKMRSRHLEGSGWCALCRSDEESTTHLFLKCPFILQIWVECSGVLNQVCRWKGPNIEEAWREWSSNPQNHNIKALPLLINWGVWLARNSTIFNEKPSIPELIVAQSLSILSHFPQGKEEQPVRNVVTESVDHSRSWAYFDGASQNDGQVCGGGAVLHLTDTQIIMQN
jgi:hypothetical protein